jgi:hypothetical protein
MALNVRVRAGAEVTAFPYLLFWVNLFYGAVN